MVGHLHRQQPHACVQLTLLQYCCMCCTCLWVMLVNECLHLVIVDHLLHGVSTCVEEVWAKGGGGQHTAHGHRVSHSRDDISDEHMLGGCTRHRQSRPV
jgi:hypothetical protein